MHCSSRRVCLVIASLLIPAALVGAQQGVQLNSRTLGETRTIDVSLPRGYAGSSERYPVIVVLDGEFEHEIASGIAHFYASTSMLPRAIVVGVRNTNRNRDLTPAPLAGFAIPPDAEGAGGGDRFLSFIGDELVPYLDHTYRTAPMRVLVGHSLGGLFALHALGKRPELFTGYVVMEPSTWWNNGSEVRVASTVLTQQAARRARVMLVNALPLSSDTVHWGGDAPMVRNIEITGETHESMAAAGMLQGLKTLFADFRPSGWKPGTKPVAMLERYDSLSARVGYEIPIPESAYVTAIRMSIDGRYFDDASRMLARLDKAFPGSRDAKEMHARFDAEHGLPAPAGWIPLEIPAKRPSPRDAARFIGTWRAEGGTGAHEVSIRASGDTIIVHDRIQFPTGQWDEADHQVVQLTPSGTLEWGLPWFQGLAALLVLKGEVQPDGTMKITREARGWVPRGPADGMMRAETMRRVGRD